MQKPRNFQETSMKIDGKRMSLLVSGRAFQVPEAEIVPVSPRCRRSTSGTATWTKGPEVRRMATFYREKQLSKGSLKP